LPASRANECSELESRLVHSDIRHGRQDLTDHAHHVHPTRQGVSIVIPAYNEEHGIRGVLDSLFTRIARLDFEGPWEVIVVNDGSRDDTAREVAAFSEIVMDYWDDEKEAEDRLILVSHDQNCGYGAALKTGVRASRYPWILITDADGTYPDEAVGQVLSHGDQFDMVVGARIGAVSNIPLLRRPPKWVLRKFASYLARREIPDLNSGLRLMRKDVVERFIHILPNGFSFTTTITLAMLSEGKRVKYIEIDYLKRTGSSKIRPIYDTLNFLQLIVRTMMYFEPLRIFIPAAGIFMFGSAVVGAGSYFLLDRMLDSTTMLLFVTGVQLLAIGMLADVINKRLGGR
jgi:glycosyltransferase involved in cell wall biosynthesis